MKDLPAKYYLQHFHEFLRYIEGPCGHLLDDADREFLHQFESLGEDARCLVVRMANRKSPVIKVASLFYNEIQGVTDHLDTLKNVNLIRTLESDDLPSFWPQCTKEDMCRTFEYCSIPYKRSASKAVLVEQATQQIDFDRLGQAPLLSEVMIRNFDEPLNYFLYLFFGNLRSRLNKFSMRDMGIMRTRKKDAANKARFADIGAAKTSYHYAKKNLQLTDLTISELIEEATERDAWPIPQGERAVRYYNRYLFNLGKAVAPEQNLLAMALWQDCQQPEAQEKWIREAYKAGQKNAVEEKLKGILEQPESETLLLFAEDFLARKFAKKRTSVLTDMLRENAHKVAIDETFRDCVEQGVIDHYARSDVVAVHTENGLWRSLFGLVFWQTLFEADDAALATEFDYHPRALRENLFYSEFGTQIEALLDTFAQPKALTALLTKNATGYYGTLNSLFHWHPGLLETLLLFVNQAPITAICEQLRAMAKRFDLYADGYPDLLVYDQGGVRLEEIKAPGDQLRKNQLLCIRQLRKSGFEVSVQQVSWVVDPMQPYAVVDIETTGGKSEYDRITEIGVVKMVGGEVVDSWQSLVNPMRHIPRFITQLTGIDNNMVKDAPPFCEVADTLVQLFKGCVFVAHNVNFDYGFIRREFERLERSFSMPKLCTVREMRKAVPGLPSYSLGNLAEHFDIDMTRHHRAMSDAQAAAELLKIINEHRLTQQQEQQKLS